MENPNFVSNRPSVDRPADLSITFDMNLKEHVRAQRSMIFHHPAGKVLCGMFVGVPLAMLIYLLFRGPDPDPESWLLAGAALVLGAGAMYSFGWLQVLSLRKGQAGIAGPHTMRLSDAGIRMESPHHTVDYTWEGIFGVRETTEFIFVQLGKNVAYFIPKRVLTPETGSRLCELFRSQLGTRAAVWTPTGE